MNKREFLRSGLLGAAVVSLSPISVRVHGSTKSQGFTLPRLPYAFNALEPYIDAMTMEIHHGKHHLAYINKLNEALKDTPEANWSIEKLLVEKSKTDMAIRNHGGGHYNHDLFWQTLSPKTGQRPSGKLLAALEAQFDSYSMFTEKFAALAMNRFGSGWVWLCLDASNKIFITSTPNQDNPLMNLFGVDKGFPLLGLDVWEHAYYLKYQNKRKDYVDAFWSIVNWEYVESRFGEKVK